MIMRKIQKKIGAVILCAAMLFAFTACTYSTADAGQKVSEDISAAKNTENAGNGKNVYFAGPMFNQAEKDFNLEMTELLEEYGYRVFLPQRDGIEAALLEGKTEEELIKMIFDLDDTEVMNCNGIPVRVIPAPYPLESRFPEFSIFSRNSLKRSGCSRWTALGNAFIRRAAPKRGCL